MENALEIELTDVTDTAIRVMDSGLDPEERITLSVESNPKVTLQLTDGERETSSKCRQGRPIG